MRIISYREYDKALSEANKSIGNGDIELYDMGGDSKTISIGINWCAIGTVSPDRTEEFAERLKKAAKIAREFPYNGCKIKY